jgi:hypothetical protein
MERDREHARTTDVELLYCCQFDLGWFAGIVKKKMRVEQPVGEESVPKCCSKRSMEQLVCFFWSKFSWPSSIHWKGIPTMSPSNVGVSILSYWLCWHYIIKVGQLRVALSNQ